MLCQGFIVWHCRSRDIQKWRSLFTAVLQRLIEGWGFQKADLLIFTSDLFLGLTAYVTCVLRRQKAMKTLLSCCAHTQQFCNSEFMSGGTITPPAFYTLLTNHCSDLLIRDPIRPWYQAPKQPPTGTSLHGSPESSWIVIFSTLLFLKHTHFLSLIVSSHIAHAQLSLQAMGDIDPCREAIVFCVHSGKWRKAALQFTRGAVLSPGHRINLWTPVAINNLPGSQRISPRRAFYVIQRECECFACKVRTGWWRQERIFQRSIYECFLTAENALFMWSMTEQRHAITVSIYSN